VTKKTQDYDVERWERISALCLDPEPGMAAIRAATSEVLFTTHIKRNLV
jgi:hypothetical protein